MRFVNAYVKFSKSFYAKQSKYAHINYLSKKITFEMINSELLMKT